MTDVWVGRWRMPKTRNHVYYVYAIEGTEIVGAVHLGCAEGPRTQAVASSVGELGRRAVGEAGRSTTSTGREDAPRDRARRCGTEPRSARRAAASPLRRAARRRARAPRSCAGSGAVRRPPLYTQLSIRRLEAVHALTHTGAKIDRPRGTAATTDVAKEEDAGAHPALSWR